MTTRSLFLLVVACTLVTSTAVAAEPSGAFCNESAATWAAHGDDCKEMAKAWNAVIAKYRPIVEKAPESLDLKACEKVSASQPDAESLTVVLSADGFHVRDTKGTLAPIIQCTGRAPKVTVCLRDPEAEDLLDRYDWLALYNLMMELVTDNPTTPKTLFVEAEDDVSVDVLVRLMDTLRWRRVTEEGGPEGTGQQFAFAEELDSSQPTYTALFDTISLIPPKQP